MGWLARLFHRGEYQQVSSAPAAAPAPPPPTGPFRMPVEDVFHITGRGTVVTGGVESGSVRVGQTVRVVRGGAVSAQAVVTSIEQFRATLEVATAGQLVGLLLDGVGQEQVAREDVLEG